MHNEARVLGSANASPAGERGCEFSVVDYLASTQIIVLFRVNEKVEVQNKS